MRVLASIAVFAVIIGYGIVAACADPVARTNTYFKTDAMKNELRSKNTTYKGMKTRVGPASNAGTAANARENAGLAKSVITNPAKPLVVQSAMQPSTRSAVLQVTSLDRSRLKSNFAQAQGPMAREFRPAGRSVLTKDSESQNKKGVLLNKFPRN